MDEEFLSEEFWNNESQMNEEDQLNEVNPSPCSSQNQSSPQLLRNRRSFNLKFKLHKKKNSIVDFDTWIELYTEKVEQGINSKWNISLDDHDKKLIQSGQLIDGFLDIQSISVMEEYDISIKVNSNCEILEELNFGSHEAIEKMELVCLDDYYIMKLQE